MARRKGVRVVPARMLVGYLTQAAGEAVAASEIERASRLVAQALLEQPGARARAAGASTCSRRSR